MRDWEIYSLEDFISFNPKETIPKGALSKKIAMEDLGIRTKYFSCNKNEEFSSGSKFRNGDTLFARITPCLENGKIGYVKCLEENEVAFGSTEFIVMRAKPGISNSDFVFYLGLWEELRSLAIQTMKGTSGRQRVDLDDLKTREFLLPTLVEQEAIAEVLSSLDDQIELLSKQNETLKQFSSLIFEKECKTLTKVTLSSVCDIVMGSSPKGSTYNAEQTGLPLIQGVGGFGNLTPVTEIYTSDPKRVAESFDILFSVRAPVGDLNIANQRVCIGRGVAAIQHEKPYLLYFALINAVNEYAKYNNEGTIYGSINRDDLRNIRIVNLCLPEKPEQILRDSFEKLILNDDSIQKLRRTRDALLPQLMSGALRVTDAKHVIAEEVSHA